MTGLSRLLSVIWLVMRLRFRFSLERSLSNTSPERKAETRSSNSPPSSLFSFAFLIFRSLSRCSLSCKMESNRLEKCQDNTAFCIQWRRTLWIGQCCSHACLSIAANPLPVTSDWDVRGIRSNEKNDHHFVIRLSRSRIWVNLMIF